jgi:hypothetical protein
LKGLTNLKVLWLRDNPLCRDVTFAEYKRQILSILPNLSKLDGHDVTDEDKENTKSSNEQ